MRLSDHLQLGGLNLHLDWFFEEIVNLKREIVISHRIILAFCFILINYLSCEK